MDVDRIEKREGEFTVYNFSVEDFHTYFVSDLGILVHNATGYGVGANLPDMNGFSRQEVRQVLDMNGFQPSSSTPSSKGWQKFKHPDGSQVDINWNKGRIVRTEAPIYGADGSRINKGQRLAPDGSQILRDLPHNQHPTEYFDLNS